MPTRNQNIDRQSFTKDEREDLLLRLALIERKLSLTARRLDARNQELSAIYRLSETIGSERHINRLCEKTAEEICRTLGVAASCILLKDELTGDLVAAASVGGNLPAASHPRLKPGDGLLWQVLKTGKPLHLPGSAAMRQYAGQQAAPPGIAVPIRSKDRMLGVIYACGKLSRRDFTAGERHLLMGIANQAAVALDNAGLHHKFENLLVGIAWSFAAALDAKSPWTAGHSKRVTQYAVAVAEELPGAQDFVPSVQTCGLLHDIGKIGTPGKILDKKDIVTREERRTLCEHAAQGAIILEHIDTFQPVIPGVRHHHERWDGSGFPDGLAGEDIPLLARVLAVADAFDAITSDRPYRGKRSRAEAVEEIKRCSDTQFDPRIVEAFVDACSNDVFRSVP